MPFSLEIECNSKMSFLDAETTFSFVKQVQCSNEPLILNLTSQTSQK